MFKLIAEWLPGPAGADAGGGAELAEHGSEADPKGTG